MLSRINYPNTFFSPTYPLGSKNVSKPAIAFSGVPGYEPEVFDLSLKESSFKGCQPSDPNVAQRLNLKA